MGPFTCTLMHIRTSTGKACLYSMHQRERNLTPPAPESDGKNEHPATSLRIEPRTFSNSRTTCTVPLYLTSFILVLPFSTTWTTSYRSDNNHWLFLRYSSTKGLLPTTTDIKAAPGRAILLPVLGLALTLLQNFTYNFPLLPAQLTHNSLYFIWFRYV